MISRKSLDDQICWELFNRFWKILLRIFRNDKTTFWENKSSLLNSNFYMGKCTMKRIHDVISSGTLVQKTWFFIHIILQIWWNFDILMKKLHRKFHESGNRNHTKKTWHNLQLDKNSRSPNEFSILSHKLNSEGIFYGDKKLSEIF